MFCIFLGREFEEEQKGFKIFVTKHTVIYWELRGSIYIVFY